MIFKIYKVSRSQFKRTDFFFFLITKDMKVLAAKSCPTLCDPMDCNPPGSSVYGILQARILERVAMPSSRGLPNPGIELGSPA